MKLIIGQTWISKTHPQESFRIYDGIVDTCVDSFEDETLSFNEQPESAKIFFWERVDQKAFMEFVEEKKGKKSETTYPYAWCGESKKGYLVAKIKRYKMSLLKE